MAMSMQELFYGASDPAFFVHRGRHSADPSPRAPRRELPQRWRRPLELSTFDLAVPLCCAECEERVRGALLALGDVHDVACDPRTRRVTVTGCVDPARALKQVRRVQGDATLWRSAGAATGAHRYEAPQRQSAHRFVLRDGGDGRWHGQGARESERPRSGPGGGASTRSLCPAYRDSTRTHFVSVNAAVATREEMEW